MRFAGILYEGLPPSKGRRDGTAPVAATATKLVASCFVVDDGALTMFMGKMEF